MQTRIGQDMVRVGGQVETVVTTSRDTVLGAITDVRASQHQGRADAEARLVAAFGSDADRICSAIRDASTATIEAADQARTTDLNSRAQADRRLAQDIQHQFETLRNQLVPIVAGQGDSILQRVSVLQATLQRDGVALAGQVIQTVGSQGDAIIRAIARAQRAILLDNADTRKGVGYAISAVGLDIELLGRAMLNSEERQVRRWWPGQTS
jgi:hypothetical protein